MGKIKTMGRTERKKSLSRWSLAGLELATTGLRVRVLTVRPKRHLVVSEVNGVLKLSMVSISNIE